MVIKTPDLTKFDREYAKLLKEDSALKDKAATLFAKMEEMRQSGEAGRQMQQYSVVHRYVDTTPPGAMSAGAGTGTMERVEIGSKGKFQELADEHSAVQRKLNDDERRAELDTARRRAARAAARELASGEYGRIVTETARAWAPLYEPLCQLAAANVKLQGAKVPRPVVVPDGMESGLLAFIEMAAFALDAGIFPAKELPESLREAAESWPREARLGVKRPESWTA